MKFCRLLLAVVIFLSVALRHAYAEDKLAIASFSTILTEIAQKVGGQEVTVTGLIQPGQDPHEFQLSPSDLQAVSGARLVLTSGKNLEHYFNNLRDATKADLLPVGDKLPSLKMRAGEEEKTAKSGFIEDPHWWNSVPNVEEATFIVRDELVKLDPAHADEYRANAQSYANQLQQLNGWVKQKIAELQASLRKEGEGGAKVMESGEAQQGAERFAAMSTFLEHIALIAGFVYAAMLAVSRLNSESP